MRCLLVMARLLVPGVWDDVLEAAVFGSAFLPPPWLQTQGEGSGVCSGVFWLRGVPLGVPGGRSGHPRDSPGPRGRGQVNSHTLGAFRRRLLAPGASPEAGLEMCLKELLECVELGLGSTGLELTWAEDRSSGF